MDIDEATQVLGFELGEDGAIAELLEHARVWRALGHLGRAIVDLTDLVDELAVQVGELQLEVKRSVSRDGEDAAHGGDSVDGGGAAADPA